MLRNIKPNEGSELLYKTKEDYLKSGSREIFKDSVRNSDVDLAYANIRDMIKKGGTINGF